MRFHCAAEPGSNSFVSREFDDELVLVRNLQTMLLLRPQRGPAVSVGRLTPSSCSVTTMMSRPIHVVAQDSKSATERLTSLTESYLSNNKCPGVS
jgi:hypothetical protein